MSDNALKRVLSALRNEALCEFQWPGVLPMTGSPCGEPVVGVRDGKRACKFHISPYVPTQQNPYDDGDA